MSKQADKVEIESPYSRLAAINVNEHTEKKNGLTYLSWAWAWDQLMRADPAASVEYHEPQKFGKDTYMVSCTVTAFGLSRRMFLPVMDHRNKAIPDPDAFQFNTAMMRCLVKAIALHGLGLYIYAGEDLPEGEEKPQHKSVAKETAATLDEARLAQAREAADECLACLPDEIAFYEAYEAHKSRLDVDAQVAMWGMLYGGSTPFPSANSVKTALAKGKAKLEAEIAAQA